MNIGRIALTTVDKFTDEDTNVGCVNLNDIFTFDESKYGHIEKALFTSYLLDIDWIMETVGDHLTNSKILFVTQYSPELEDYQSIINLSENIHLHLVQVPRFGTFHSKLIILFFEKYVRIVILTANLCKKDWENHTQALWCKDFSLKSDSTLTSSIFENDMKDYLEQIGGVVSGVAKALSLFDFSSVDEDTRLVASVPGVFSGSEKKKYGAERVQDIIALNNTPGSNNKLAIQFSSFSAFGNEWLENYFAPCFGFNNPKDIQIIYPTFNRVKTCVDGIKGGRCLPADKKNSRNPDIIPYLYEWNAEISKRTRHTPHIKSYCSYSSNEDTNTSNTEIEWFLLTSSNLSKSAWGVPSKNNTVTIKSYELGVMLFPMFHFKKDSKYHNPNSKLKNISLTDPCNTLNGLLIPYDLPPTKYSKDDITWASPQFK